MLFPVAETLQLMRFVGLEGGDIRLTPAAKRYVLADVDTRKPDERAPTRRFRDELEDDMSEDYAEQTLRAVVGWGRYAEAFAYDEGTDVFSLETPA